MKGFSKFFALAAAVLVLAPAPASASPDPTGGPVPFTAVAMTEDWYSPPTCEGATWTYNGEGTGSIPTMGIKGAEVALSHCSYLQTSSFGPGTITFTTPDGTLTMSHWGTFAVHPHTRPEPIISVVDSHWEITGGTGRFEGAQGAGKAVPIGHITKGDFGITRATWTGWIELPND